MMALAQRAMAVLDENYDPHGYNVGFNQGRVAGAGYEDHIHLHVVPALGRRHELHAGARRHAGDAAVAGGQLRGAEGRVLSDAVPARDLQGLRHPRPLRRGDGRRHRLPGRPRVRARARRPARQGAGRPSGRPRPRHAASRRRRWRAGSATGWSTRAAPCSTPGMVGTEMLYYLVGSRELDGGAMVTASHNPKAYTGVKLVREGALALSGDAGNRRRPRRDRGRAAGAARRRDGRGGRHLRRLSPSRPGLHRPGPRSSRCGSSSTAATGWPGRWSARCSSASASTW